MYELLSWKLCNSSSVRRFVKGGSGDPTRDTISVYSAAEKLTSGTSKRRKVPGEKKKGGGGFSIESK